ncbi:hypothetical protein Cgig2_015895 [Carnegiea gigantea]|uniref:Uncharacterized protein n=1 Tax=Carnegiea gigantea TaxID=171969 RepID=A0A9Q1GIF1_9CARY|nr:hypothetical protein Cgig2_015895 [Carnegiea gigantea]
MRDKACKSSKNRGEGVDKFGEKRTTKIRGFFLGTAFGRSRGCGQRSGPCAQRPGAAPSVQGLRPASRTSGQRSQAAASVQELRPAFTGLRPASGTSGQRSQGCGQRSQPAASVQDKPPAFTGLRPAFTACGQRPAQAASVHRAAASVHSLRPAAQRAFVAVPGVDINRADFSYSARAIPLESFRRFGGRARNGHQPCLFFILRPDHPPRELQEVWLPCPEWTSTVPIFHTQLGQVTACGQRSQASGQRSQYSGQRSQAAASVQDKRPAFTGCCQRSQAAASVQDKRPAFTACGQRSQAAANVQDKRPAFTGCGQRSGQAAHRRTLDGHLASTAWKQCPHSVLHPEAQPKAIAQAACARRRDAGGRRPQPEGPTRHPKGASSERSSR